MLAVTPYHHKCPLRVQFILRYRLCKENKEYFDIMFNRSVIRLSSGKVLLHDEIVHRVHRMILRFIFKKVYQIVLPPF